MNLRATIFSTSLVFASTLAAATFAPLAVAQSADNWPVPAQRAVRINPIPTSEHSTDIGESIYTDGCNGCHGPSFLVGNDMPRLQTTAVLDQSDGELFWKIKHGRKGMPGFKGKLRNRQIWHIINYMRSDKFQD